MATVPDRDQRHKKTRIGGNHGKCNKGAGKDFFSQSFVMAKKYSPCYFFLDLKKKHVYKSGKNPLAPKYF
jgi:hypothetical protein